MIKKITKKTQSFNGIDISFLGGKDDSAEQRTVLSRKKLRDSVNEQIEEYLNEGGKIKTIPNHLKK